MLENLIGGAAGSAVTLTGFAVCTAVSLVLGVLAALIYMYRTTYSKSFVVTLALLPAMVQIVIMLVNGNLGAGVAVMGAFSLVRFRSVPGSAREIGAIFFAMAIGLATGMGYLLYAVLFLVFIGAASLLLSLSPFGSVKADERELKITIPESLDFDGIFDDLLERYTTAFQLQSVHTSNMGSLYVLNYRIRKKNAAALKEFLDALRCRNGNLNISCGRAESSRDEL